MDYLVPGLIVLVCAAIAALLMWRSGRAERAATRQTGETHGTDTGQTTRPAKSTKPTVSRDTAAEASAKLSMEQHSVIYSRIAEGQQVAAIAEYRKAAGGSLRHAVAAVASMASYPQPFKAPQPPAPPETINGPETTMTAQTGDEPTKSPKYRYRAIVSHGEDVREIASTDLDDEIFADIRRHALAGERDEAIQMLMAHSDASVNVAAEFVGLINEEDHH